MASLYDKISQKDYNLIRTEVVNILGPSITNTLTFQGSISGTILTITTTPTSSPAGGILQVGQVLSGTGITSGTKITGRITVPAGTTGVISRWNVSISQTVSSTTITAKQASATGYGQPLQSSSVEEGTRVGRTDWENLKQDIINAYTHQNGTSLSLTSNILNDIIRAAPITFTGSIATTTLTVTAVVDGRLAVGQTIAGTGINAGTTITGFVSGDPAGASVWTINQSYSLGSRTLTATTTYPHSEYLQLVNSSRADDLVTNKFKLASNQLVLVEKGNKLENLSFTSSASILVTVAFPTAKEAREFFNSGSEIRFTSSSNANVTWQSLLTSASNNNPRFGGNVPQSGTSAYDGRNYYRLTSSQGTEFFTQTSGSYTFSISARAVDLDISAFDNRDGTAKIIEFLVSWRSTTTTVSTGQFSLTVNSYEAFGALVPSGTFRVTSPTVTLGNFLTFTMSGSPTTINEGESVSVSASWNQSGLSLFWTANGTNVDAADFLSGAISGSAGSSPLSLTLTAREDVKLEGDETFVVNLRQDSTSGTIVASTPTITIKDTSFPPPTFTIAENSARSFTMSQPVSFTISTTNFSSSLFWKCVPSNNLSIAPSSAQISSVGGGVLSSNTNPASGAVTLSGTYASSTAVLTLNFNISNTSTFNFRLQLFTGADVGSPSGPVTVTPIPPTFSISPTSAATIGATRSITFTFTTTNYSSTVNWVTEASTGSSNVTNLFTTVTGGTVSTSDPLGGTVTMSSGSGSIRLTFNYGGASDLKFVVRMKDSAGTTVATSGVITVSATIPSPTPTFSITSPTGALSILPTDTLTVNFSMTDFYSEITWFANSLLLNEVNIVSGGTKSPTANPAQGLVTMTLGANNTSTGQIVLSFVQPLTLPKTFVIEMYDSSNGVRNLLRATSPSITISNTAITYSITSPTSDQSLAIDGSLTVSFSTSNTALTSLFWTTVAESGFAAPSGTDATATSGGTIATGSPLNGAVVMSNGSGSISLKFKYAGASTLKFRFQAQISQNGTRVNVGSPSSIITVSASATKYLALAHNNSPFISTYGWNESAGILGFTGRYADPASSLPNDSKGIAFSPAGNAIVIAHASAPRASAYAWSSAGYGTKYDSPTSIPAQGNGVAFHPSGTAVAIAHDSSPFVTVFPWSAQFGFGAAVPGPATPITGAGNGVAFSPDGKSIAIAHNNSPYITTYEFNINNLLTGPFGNKFPNPAVLPTSNATGVAIHPAGNVLAVSTTNSPRVVAYNWSSTSGFISRISSMPVIDEAPGTTYGVAFSPLGTIIALAHNNSPFLTAYYWTNGGFGAKIVPSQVPAGNARCVAFNKSGSSIAVGHAGSPYISVYQVSGNGFVNKYQNPTPGSTPSGPVFGIDFYGI